MKRTRSLVILTLSSIILVLGLLGATSAQVGRSEGLANPDLASEKELLALPHMNAKIVKEIMERRPFLKMAGLIRSPRAIPQQRPTGGALRKNVRSDKPQHSDGRRNPDDSGYRQADAP